MVPWLEHMERCRGGIWHFTLWCMYSCLYLWIHLACTCRCPKQWKIYQKIADHVYLRHLLTEYRSILSADMSAESRPIYRPTLGRYVGQVSVDTLFKLIDCRSTLSVDMSVDTRPTPRSVCCDRQSLVYWSTVGDVSIDYRWYRSIDTDEIAAITLPTGYAFRLCSCVDRGRM